MADTFTDILNRQSNTIERPKPIPVGTYLWVVQGLPRQDKSQKKGTPFVEFTCKPLSAQDNVDPDDLGTMLTRADGQKKALQDQVRKLTFYLTEDALWRLTKFLDDCQAGDESMTLAQRISETPNCQFYGDITHSSSEDGEATYANISKTFAVS
jgi:hypothetical protein